MRDYQSTRSIQARGKLDGSFNAFTGNDSSRLQEKILLRRNSEHFPQIISIAVWFRRWRVEIHDVGNKQRTGAVAQGKLPLGERVNHRVTDGVQCRGKSCPQIVIRRSYCKA